MQVFFIRANQNWGNRDFYPRVGGDVDAAEVLEAFLGQFYDSKEPPRQLILSHRIENADLMTEALATSWAARSRFWCPSAAKRPNWSRRAAQCPREPGAQDGRDRDPGQAAQGVGRGV